MAKDTKKHEQDAKEYKKGEFSLKKCVHQVVKVGKSISSIRDNTLAKQKQKQMKQKTNKIPNQSNCSGRR